jgi:hypothetical protein
VRVAALLAVSLGTLLGTASAAPAAEFGIAPGSLSIRALDPTGDPFHRAGGHPDRLRLEFALNAVENGEATRDMVFALPPGLVGNPRAVAACPRDVFDQFAVAVCPPEAQIGTIELGIAETEEPQPIFNVAPAPDELATFGINFVVKFPIGLSLRPGDFGIEIEQRDSPQVFRIDGARIELWGVPADRQAETSTPRRPLLTTPTRCGEPLSVALRVRSWRPGAPWVTASAQEQAPLTGCQELGFEPSLEFELTDPKADAPTGARVEVDVPQSEDADGTAASHLRAARVTLPDGMTISPVAAAGLSACTDSQLALGSAQKPSCPSRSRVGTLELLSPQLEEPLDGVLYAGEQHPDDRFRLFAVAKGPGIEAKLAGSLRPDPETGRLTAVLDDLPQLPFSRLGLRFDDGPGALLIAPLRCGPATAVASFEPYSGTATVESKDTATIAPARPGSSCAGEPPFAPTFVAGTTPARAGRATTFSMTLRRGEGEQAAERLSVAFPLGLTARLRAAERCDSVAAAQGRCPAAARIGSALVEIGPDPGPQALSGDVFLTGPHRGAPLGMAMTFDAVLGPFDLGELTIRAAMRLDSRSGRVTVETDPLPRLVEGLPVRLRTIGLDIDRPGFMLNPTSCERAEIAATARSTGGDLSRLSSRFRARRCDALDFRPRISIGSTGAGGRRDGNPGLRVTIRSRPGDTNLRAARIALPRTLGFDPSGLQAICSHRDAIDGACPRNARVGSALARTPLLRDPLSGSVYVVQPHGTGLPDLWTAIEGSGIRLDLRAKTRVAGRRVHATLLDLPDLPLSSFTMRLGTGGQSVLRFDRSPCAATARGAGAVAVLEGQNGAARIARTRIRPRGCEPGSERGTAATRGREMGAGVG